MSCCLEKVCAVVGGITLSYLFLKLLYNVYHALRVYAFPTYPDFSKYGKWAVVTGSTDGIGKEIAKQLASRGQNIVLIARNEEKLKAVEREIAKQYGVQTKYIQIDFSDDEFIYDKIEVFLKDLDIGVLVNNVGIAVGGFLKIPNLSTTLRNITRINIFSVLKMTQIVLPGMVQRKRGLIINVSSVSACTPVSPMATYGATKAFVNYFSNALSYEYEDHGITINSCMPGYIDTNLTADIRNDVIFLRPADKYVASLLATVDKERWTYGCWQHAFFAWLVRQLPLKYLNRMLKANKAAKEKKQKKSM